MRKQLASLRPHTDMASMESCPSDTGTHSGPQGIDGGIIDQVVVLNTASSRGDFRSSGRHDSAPS